MGRLLMVKLWKGAQWLFCQRAPEPEARRLVLADRDHRERERKTQTIDK